MSVDASFLYTSLEEATVELKKRQKNTELRLFMNSLLGELPESLKLNGGRAVFSRYIATPSLETEHFIALAKQTELQPLIFEFLSDKLVARNWEKYCLCRMSFVDSLKDRDKKKSVHNLINFNQEEGKKFTDVKTLDGKSLIDFHHDLLSKKFLDKAPEYLDFSDWFLPNRGSDKWSYYLRYLSLFLCDGILFENFLTNERELSFTSEVVIPAFRTIYDVTGLKPLIVRLLPEESENSDYWCYYDKDTKALIH